MACDYSCRGCDDCIDAQLDEIFGPDVSPRTYREPLYDEQIREHYARPSVQRFADRIAALFRED